MINSITTDHFILMGICALLTYGLRLGGLLLAEKLPQAGRTRRMLDILPGTILISFVTPPILEGGPLAWGAGIVTAIIALATKRILLAVTVGMGLIFALRYLL